MAQADVHAILEVTDRNIYDRDRGAPSLTWPGFETAVGIFCEYSLELLQQQERAVSAGGRPRLPTEPPEAAAAAICLLHTAENEELQPHP